MNETKHTPGPWKFVPSFGRVEVEKFIVAYLSLSVEGRDNPLYLPKGEAEANGALIAAAPELLAEIEISLAHEYNGFEPDNQSARYHRLKALVAKAKGE